MTVVGCVAAIVAAYQDGADLLTSIKERRRNSAVTLGSQEEDKLINELEKSLVRGSDVVQSQYERDFKKLGVPFATGDEIAKFLLEDIVETMKREIIFPLSSAWQKNSKFDNFRHLQDVSDESQDRSIMCLMQLHQRLSVAATINDMVPPPPARMNTAPVEAPRPAPTELGPSSADAIRSPSFSIGGAKATTPSPTDSARSSRNKLSYIVPEPASRLTLQSFKEAFTSRANSVVSSAPIETSTGDFDHRSSQSKATNIAEPRIQHVSSMKAGNALPIEYRGEDDMYEHSRPDEIYSELPFKHEYKRFDDSPTYSPAEVSSTSSMSSRGSSPPSDPEWAPWATGSQGSSPLTSLHGTTPPDSYERSLVPDALSPRRYRDRDSRATDHSRMSRNTTSSRHTDHSARYTDYSRGTGTDSSRSTTYSHNTQYSGKRAEHSRNVSVEQYLSSSIPTKSVGLQDDLDEFFANGKDTSRLWLSDEASVYSRESRYDSPERNNSAALSHGSRQNSLFGSKYRSGSQPASTARQGSHSTESQRQGSHSSHGEGKDGLKSDSQQFTSNPVSVFRQPAQIEPRLNTSYNPTPLSPKKEGLSVQTKFNSSGGLGREASLRKSPSLGWLSSRTSGRLSDRIPAAIQENRTPPPPVPARIPRFPGQSMATMPYSGSIASSSSATIILPATPTSPISVHSSTGGMSTFQTSRMSVSTTNSAPGARPVPKALPAARTIPPFAIGNNKLCLPSEQNKFAGFCKGAWRAQIGDKKKTYEERVRPAALYSKNNTYYKCQKCNFEGRAIKPPGAKKTVPDNKVYGSNGVLYRWEFLYKSHVHLKNTLANPLDSHFGCVFCCAAGKGTPIFEGVASLLAHLQEHRNVLPEGEVLFRMNAIVGRSPDPEEDFDVALPAFVL